MNPPRSLLLVVLLLSTAAGLASEAPQTLNEWQLRKDAAGISVYSRPVPGTNYQEFKAITEFPGQVGSALALLNDTAACSQWLYRCVESRIITPLSNLEGIYYQVSKLPFPAKARELIFHAIAHQEPAGGIRVSMTARPELLAPTKLVRIQHAYGTYLLEPLANASSRLTWQQYIDPAGKLPAWIVNKMLVDLPFNSLQNFRRLVTQPPYRDTTIGYNEAGKPTLLIRDGLIPDGLIPEGLIPAPDADDSSASK